MLVLLLGGGNAKTWAETSTVTYSFSSKAWEDDTKSWTSKKDGFQFNSSTSPRNVQVTATYTGAGATSKVSYTNISSITVKAATTSKGVGNISIKVGNGEAQTICSLNKNTTFSEYTINYETPISGTVTFTVNCSTNSVYMASIAITTDSEGGTTTLDDSDLALTDAPINLSFDLNNATAQTINYTSSSTGAVTVSESDYITAVVDEAAKTITVTPNAVTNSTQTITVSQAADDTYAAGTTTFTVDITDSTPVDSYVKVTDASTLNVGDKLLIVCESKSTVAGNIGSNYMSSLSATFNNSVLSVRGSEGYNVLTLGGTSGRWTLYSESQEAYLSGSEDNLATSEDAPSTGWNITFDNGNLVLKYGTGNKVQFNASSPRFKPYSSNQTAVQLYRKVDNRTATTLTFAEESVTLDLNGNASVTAAIPAVTLKAGNDVLSKEISYTCSDGLTYSNGQITATAVGEYTITASFVGDNDYKAAIAVCEVTVVNSESANDVAFNIQDRSLSFGEALTLTQGTDESTYNIVSDGNVTLSSSNSNVATVSGLTITPVAVGTTTITINTEASVNYKAGTTSFVVSVTSPSGKTNAFVGEDEQTIFSETFNKCNQTLGNDGNWTESGQATAYSDGDGDNAGWILTNNGAVRNQCISVGSSKNKGSAKTPSISTVNGAKYTLTFKAAPWGNDDNTSMNVAVNGGTITGISEDDMTAQAWNVYTATITATGNAIDITFSATANRFFLDDVVLTKQATIFSESVKFNTSGYATYCSLYPLDFTNAEGYTAWQITSISSDNVITFEKVAGAVKGGTGLLLKGNAGATVTLTSADSETALSGNKLIGTLAPTYISAGEYYGLSGTTFVKVNAGTVPAGKALLPANLVTESAGPGVKAFTFVFNDLTTGVNAVDNGQWTMDNGAIFDLSGRRLSKPAKGINIINGKKVVVK